MTHLDVDDPKPWTAGDATSLGMTLARATCLRCGHTGKETDSCTADISPLDTEAIEEAVKQCPNRRRNAA